MWLITKITQHASRQKVEFWLSKVESLSRKYKLFWLCSGISFTKKYLSFRQKQFLDKKRLNLELKQSGQIFEVMTNQTVKELILCHKLKLSNPYTCANWWRKPLLFQTLLFDLTEFIVWNIWGLQHWFAKILGLKNQSLWQRLNSFIQMRKLIKVSFMDLTLSRMGGGIFHLPLFVIFLYSIKTSYTKALNLLHFLSIIKYNYFFQHFSDVLFERLKPT